VIRTIAITIAVVAALGGGAAAEDARIVVEEASRAMGVTGLDSIAFAGTATYGNIGQSRRISFGLASTTIGNFTRTIDFAYSAMHTTGVAGSPAVPGNPAPGFLEETVASTADVDGNLRRCGDDGPTAGQPITRAELVKLAQEAN